MDDAFHYMWEGRIINGMPSILIVCTANMCRSPMGEALLKQALASRPDADQWRVESAGTWADRGNPATLYSQVVMQKMGLDISKHCSQPIDENFIKQFDLILTMESHHKEGLKVVFRQYASRIFMISEMVGVVEDISDPIGGDYEDYQEVAFKLGQYFSNGLDKIVELATSPGINRPSLT